ncbi:MAG: AAA family ATPase [Candidatus Obscuribacterales bacterium]|nr:AAA family ATPase [Candidatus Obscuribacterales bacterium]
MTAVSFEQGSRLIVDWEANPSSGGVKSNRASGARSPKIILCEQGGSDVIAPQAGQRWLCEIVRITKPRSERNGAIIVRPVSQQIDCSFDNVWIDPEQAQLMSVVLQNRFKNLFLEGPQGCGKTTISRSLAKRLNWEFRLVQGAQIKSYRQMYGRTQQTIVDGQVQFVFEDSPLVKIIREAIKNPDKIFLTMIDEYTRIDEDARDVLLGVIEGEDRQLQTPKPEIIHIPSNIRWMAAGNVGSGFTVKDQDDANASRWVVFEVDYMPYDAQLKDCLRKYPDCPREGLEKALKVIFSLRKISPEMHLSKCICSRMIESVTMFLAAGIEIKTAMITAVANQFSGRMNNDKSQRARVANKIREALEGKNIEDIVKKT